jgi:hypothetical protein
MLFFNYFLELAINKSIDKLKKNFFFNLKKILFSVKKMMNFNLIKKRK